MRLLPSIRATATFSALIGILAISGCAEYQSRPSAIEDTLSRTSFEVPEQREPAGRAASRPEALAPAASSAALFLGGGSLNARPAAAANRVADGVQINFDGAEIREVVKVVLGDILGATYSIDPGITGQVVLSSSGPLSESQMLGVLETTLQMHGAALSRTGDGAYAVTLRDLAVGGAAVTPLGGSVPPIATPGSGVTIVPLRFVGAEAAAQFIQPLLTRPDQVRVDDTRNLLLFVGSSAERQTVLDTLADIDVNWMAGRSVGIFPLKMSTPEAIIPELEALITPLSGNGQSSETVRFLAMARLNAVLVIASQPEQVVEIERWIGRLDRGNTVGIQFFVYQLQHVPAEDMAKILTEVFGSIDDSESGTRVSESGVLARPSTGPVDDIAVALEPCRQRTVEQVAR